MNPAPVSASARRRAPGRAFLAIGLVAIVALTACGGMAGPDDGFDGDDFPDGGNGQPIGRPSDGGGSGPGPDTGDPNAPIAAIVDGVTHGFEVGRCEFLDNGVYARARRNSQNGGFELELPAWEAEMAYAERDGRIALTHSYPAGGFLELVADGSSIGTTWEWTTSGNQVEVTARMGDRATADFGESGYELVDWYDVTITIDCVQGTFGTAMPGVPEYAHEAFTPRTPGFPRAPGSVTVELDGTAYVVDYLSTCVVDASLFESVLAEGTSNDAWLFLSGSGGFGSYVTVGDRRDFDNRIEYTFGDEVMTYDISGSTATWSGTMTSAAGQEVPATITITCG